MVVCIEPGLGFFFRINTRASWQQSVAITRAAHPFLDHDSYIECGDPLELDDFVVDESIRRRGVIGAIDPSVVARIWSSVESARTLSPADKALIRAALGVRP